MEEQMNALIAFEPAQVGFDLASRIPAGLVHRYKWGKEGKFVLQALKTDEKIKKSWVELVKLMPKIVKLANMKYGIIGPKAAKLFREHLDKVLDYLYDKAKQLNSVYWKKGKVHQLPDLISGLPAKHDFIQNLLSHKLNNMRLWIFELEQKGIEPFLINFQRYEKLKNNEQYKGFLRAINKADIHVLFDVSTSYTKEHLKELIGKGSFVAGHDLWLNKSVFSALPAFLWNHIDDLKKEGKISQQYYDAVKNYFNRSGTRVLDMVPPFVSFPADVNIDEEFVDKVFNFLKGKSKKVIVKGELTANSGMDLPYRILDTEGDEKFQKEKWLIMLRNYQSGYRQSVFFKHSNIMVQCVVDNLMREGNQIKAIARKHNVVGDAVWDYGIGYILYYKKERWDDNHPTDMGGLIAGFGHGRSGFDKENPKHQVHLNDLKIAAEFLNLVSPIGAHALDFTIGRVEKDVEKKIYLLEANGSSERADYIGSTYWANHSIFEGYARWAVDHAKGDFNAAGRFTRHLFQELDAEARKAFIEDLHNVLNTVNSLLNHATVLCSKDEFLILAEKPIPKLTPSGRLRAA